MADERVDKRVTFNSSRRFRIVQICGTFRLQRIKTHAPRVRFLLIPFRPNLSVIPTLSVSSPAINIQQEQDKSGNSSRVPLHFIGHFANLACFVI